MNLAPIVLFTYKRLWHTKQTVEALQKNIYAEQSYLFIFSDGPKTEKDEPKVKEVRKYLKTIKGFKNIEIIERDKNWGLANNISMFISPPLKFLQFINLILKNKIS